MMRCRCTWTTSTCVLGSDVSAPLCTMCPPPWSGTTALAAQAASPFRRLLIAAEFGHAPWMYLRKFRGGGAARAFALAIAVGSLYRWLLARLALLVPARTSPALRQEAERQRARASSLLDWARRSRTDFQRHFRAQFASDDVWEQLRVMVLAEDAPPVRASSKGHEWSA